LRQRRKARLRVILVAGMACYCATVGTAGYSQEKTLWQIGTFDQSSEEFGLSFGFGALSGVQPDPVYHVGQSDWKKDWSGFQPGSANGRAGGREHPFTVVFSLDGPPRGLYTLTVAVLPYMPRRPNLRVEINGKRGLFYLRPHLSYDLGNFPVAFIPQYSFQQLAIEIPTDYLRPGENKLVLTCVDAPSTPEDSYGTVGLGISGIFYDALCLSQDSAKKFLPTEIKAEAKPTVFYQQKGAELAETVEVIVRLNRKISKGRVQLDFNARHDSASLSPDPDFGEQLVDFAVPEWSGTATGQLRVEAGERRNFQVALEPERKWTAFLVPHTHLDVGYTDYQGKVAETQPRVLIQAADFVTQNPDFRFSMDAAWNLEQLLSTRSKEKQEEILNLIRQGKIALPVQYCNLLTGYASLETLYRSLYPSKAMARRYKLPFEYANITDVPSYSWAYPSVLADSGVKYWAAAGNNWRAPFLLYGLWNEKSPFWWAGPDGKKILYWYSRHYMQVQSLFGLPPVLPAVRDSLPVFLQAYSKPEYKPDVVMIYGTQVENTDLVPGAATFIQGWNREYAYPKLQYATFVDFFNYIDDHYGKQLPTYKGDAGPYWEDGIGGDASYVAEDRANQNRALSAETLAAVSHTLDPSLHPPTDLVADIWRNIVLFSEHTWASYNSITQPDHVEALKQLEVKDGRATAARLEIDDLINRSLSQLADQIHVPADTLVVFNSLNWRRDALVETDLFDHAVVKDLTTGSDVPLEVLWKKEGFLHVRFMARDIPSVGYKCYAISYPAEGPVAPPAPAAGHDSSVENAFYRVTLDPASGAVSGIFDKQLNRDIVDAKSAYKFGQYLYVTGGDGNTQIMRPIKTWPVAELTVHPASGGELVGVTKTPFGQSIRLRSKATNTPEIATEILLFDKGKKIEFINRVHKDAVTSKEGVYFAFPAATEMPGFAYAIQEGWVDPAHDLLKGASLEWFNVQYWMASRDGQLTVAVVPLDAPLASFGDINRGLWPSEFKPKSSTMFSYVMNNYWDTNYRAAQGGEFVFRYVVTSDRSLDPQALARLGWDSLRPVELDYVVGQDKVGNPDRPLPAEGTSFLEVDQPNVVLANWKDAEDGEGVILRLVETGGRETTASLRFPRLAVKSAQLCNGVEDNLRPLSPGSNSLNLRFHPYEVVTVRIQ
jgi:alpha-mannosidase